MRYLSDDGKLFNTAEECKKHEKSLAVNQEKEKRIKEIKDKCNLHQKLLDEIDILVDSFMEDYSDSYMKDLDFILKDMKNPEILDTVIGLCDEIEKMIKRKK